MVDFHRDERGPAWLLVSGDLPAAELLTGAWIRVHNDGVRDACYAIRGASRQSDGHTRLDLGDTALVRGLVDRSNYSRGFTHNVACGDAWEIQTVVHLRFDGGQPSAVTANGGWTLRES